MDNKMSNDFPIKEAVVLAGGLGTRLRGVIGEYPKPLAPINETPFLTFILDYLHRQNIETVVLSVGYKWEMIRNHFGEQYKGIKLHYCVEETPLGTGGGIKLALENKALKGKTIFVLNGDTLFNIPLNELANHHSDKQALCTLALLEIAESDRYGTIEMDATDRITLFKEKSFVKKAQINGGIYCMNRNALSSFEPNVPFSFENDFLTAKVNEVGFYGKSFQNYFKDIGIPSDYEQFATDVTENKIKL